MPEDIDIIIHAAALKQVPAAEYNPFEFIKTNIIGAQNLIEACLNKKTIKVLALSTDKAASPINLYGATKLCSDKLFIAANNIAGKKKISFSIVRYGNVFGSRGSVLPLFLKAQKQSYFPITNKEMTRFNITLDQGVEFVKFCIDHSIGGEIFVPKLKSIRVVDIADAINPRLRKEIIGLRSGEKLHELMISKEDHLNTYEFDKGYVIFPNLNKAYFEYFKNINIKKFKNFFFYIIEIKDFLILKEIKLLIKNYKYDKN